MKVTKTESYKTTIPREALVKALQDAGYNIPANAYFNFDVIHMYGDGIHDCGTTQGSMIVSWKQEADEER